MTDALTKARVMRKDAPIISLFDVGFRYQGGVGRATIEIPRGTWAEIQGAPSSGKSFLFQILSLRARPRQGRMIFAGRNLSKFRGKSVSELRRITGSASEQPVFLEQRSVIENLALPYVTRKEPRMALDACERSLETLGMPHLRDIRLEELGAEERANVAIARACIGSPAAVVIDGVHESLANLEPALRLLKEAHLAGSSVVLLGRRFSENARSGLQFRLDEGAIIVDGESS